MHDSRAPSLQFLIRIFLLKNRTPSLGEGRDNTALVETGTELITQKDKPNTGPRTKSSYSYSRLFLSVIPPSSSFSQNPSKKGTTSTNLTPAQLQTPIVNLSFTTPQILFLLVYIVNVGSIFVQCLLFSLFLFFVFGHVTQLG